MEKYCVGERMEEGVNDNFLCLFKIVKVALCWVILLYIWKWQITKAWVVFDLTFNYGQQKLWSYHIAFLLFLKAILSVCRARMWDFYSLLIAYVWMVFSLFLWMRTSRNIVIVFIDRWIIFLLKERRMDWTTS